MEKETFFLIGCGVYAVGAIGTFLLNASMGPITPGLSALRGVIWPYFWLTGKPEGQRLPMD